MLMRIMMIKTIHLKDNFLARDSQAYQEPLSCWYASTRSIVYSLLAATVDCKHWTHKEASNNRRPVVLSHPAEWFWWLLWQCEVTVCLDPNSLLVCQGELEWGTMRTIQKAFYLQKFTEFQPPIKRMVIGVLAMSPRQWAAQKWRRLLSARRMFPENVLRVNQSISKLWSRTRYKINIQLLV